MPTVWLNPQKRYRESTLKGVLLSGLHDVAICLIYKLANE
jgi:hypothetical protein